MKWRNAEQSDYGYILTYLTRDWVACSRNDMRSKKQLEKIIPDILSSSSVKILTFKDKPEFILGFFIVRKVTDECVILWAAHVRKRYRRQGLFSGFIEKLKKTGVKKVIVLLDLKDTSKALGLLSNNFEVIDKRGSWVDEDEI